MSPEFEWMCLVWPFGPSPIAQAQLTGPSPDHTSYRSYATFRDLNGNSWLLQEVTTRLPERVDPVETAFAWVNDLASALRRPAAAHGEYKKRIGQHGANWPDWCCVHSGGAGLREAAAVKVIQ